jgi:hypothetical protein
MVTIVISFVRKRRMMHHATTDHYTWPNGPSSHGTTLARHGGARHAVARHRRRAVPPCRGISPATALRGQWRAVPCPWARRQVGGVATVCVGATTVAGEAGRSARAAVGATAMAGRRGPPAWVAAWGDGGAWGGGDYRRRRRPGATAGDGRGSSAATGCDGGGRGSSAAAGGARERREWRLEFI